MTENETKTKKFLKLKLKYKSKRKSHWPSARSGVYRTPDPPEQCHNYVYNL